MAEEVVEQETTDEFDDAFSSFADGDDPPEEETEEDPEEAAEEAAEAEPDDQLEKLRRDNEQLQHRVRSDSGRLGALQRKINDLEGQLTKGSETPSKEDISDAMTSPQKWSEIKDEYPELADGLEEYIQARLGKLDELSAKVNQTEEKLTQTEQENIRQQEISALAERHPDWQKIAPTSDFNQWLDQQPPAIQQMRHSENSSDAIWVLDQYKAERGKVKPGPSKASELQQRRQKQLAASKETPSHRRSPTTVDDTDFDAAFDYFARKQK